MKYVSFAVIVAALFAEPALAKTITLKNCTKVELSIVRDMTSTGERYSQTVKCSGDDAADPKVDDGSVLCTTLNCSGLILNSPTYTR
jgi:hypothetical protein